MDPAHPERGPGELVGNGAPVSDGNFAAGDESIPDSAAVPLPDPTATLTCDDACRRHCEAADLQHPVHRAACARVWGVGLSTQGVDEVEACRRLWADMLGRFPSPDELESECLGRSWAQTVRELIDREEFVKTQQRRFAGKFIYNNRAVNLERIYDMDALVGKLHRGLVSWDQFTAVASAHPVFIRRYDSGPDRVDALFRIFIGRPPNEHERADLSRAYAVWENGYIDHAYLGRVPDAAIAYPCVGDDGKLDPARAGACTSTLWGNHPVIIERDRRANRDEDEPEDAMWSGYLRSHEWELLQTPGRIIAGFPEFWEHTVDDVLSVYFGDRENGGPYYDVATSLPELRVELAKYLVQYNGDIRSLHFAIATSELYRQSARADASSPWPWTFGPVKQIDAEGWIASVAADHDGALGRCDRRISFPNDLVGEDANGWTETLLRKSEWSLDQNGRPGGRYADLARNLGGCPTHESGAAFRAISIVNTALQEGFVTEICAPGGDAGNLAFGQDWLLPTSINAGESLSEEGANAILEHQSLAFLGRRATDAERTALAEGINSCRAEGCSAEEFARPLCFSILSGAEVLFY